MAESEGLLLDHFLSQLYQCGEAAVSEIKNKRGKATLKGRKCMQNKTEEQMRCSEDQSVPCSTTVPRTSDSLVKKAADSLSRTPKCLVKLHAELLNSVGTYEVQAKANGEKVPNNGIVTTGEKRPVEVITFTGPRKRKKVPLVMDKDKMEEADEQSNSKQEFNLARARLEVHRFGITGYRKEQQRVLEQERAIMLGARPPKREYINYKRYQEMMKDKATAKNTNAKPVLSRKKKEERRNKKSEIIPTGQVGRFKNGALILSDSDIKRIKNKAKSKHV
ncbi:uncharacterized protein C1orf131 homolog isoform X2 [Rhincodon typus]|uniref:uncharacterized protein C1orf131 homolog isoform X2 n=1 Tax=Rhincodon typus TaxID=259920 RepID=UPI0009A42923|nr:uncharacterized protein C1orf131 homolog isoform X2 [Rhincodon typus]